MAENSATRALAGVLSTGAGRILDDLAGNLTALVGVTVSIEPLVSDTASLGPIFGDTEIYLFPIEDQNKTALNSFVAMDIPGAACTGGALIMMPADAIAQVLETRQVPDMLHDSVGEVANIIVSAIQQVITAELGEQPDFHLGANFRRMTPGKWPALPHEIDKATNWVISAGKLLFEKEAKGTILIGCAGEAGTIAPAGSGSASVIGSAAMGDAGDSVSIGSAARASDDSDLGAIDSGLKVQVAGYAADSSAVTLRSTLERLDVKVFPLHAGLTSSQPDVVFVVSRSHTDLKVRLGAIGASGRRPTLLIACSDRPTREVVLAASQGLADQFLVLPADIERLKSLLSKVPVTA